MDIHDYKKYISSETMMGPNSIRVLEELFDKYPLQLTSDDLILDLGCGKGLTSLVIAKETGARVWDRSKGSGRLPLGCGVTYQRRKYVFLEGQVRK